jgi:HSP20 family protein
MKNFLEVKERMSEEKKSQQYSGKEKRAIDVRKEPEQEIIPFSFSEVDRDFNRMIRRFEREFEDFWNIPSIWTHDIRRHGFSMPSIEEALPSIDLEDRGKDYRLTMDLPGFNKEDLDLEVTDDSLTIHARKKEEKEEKNKNYVRKERAARSFFRRIPLPERILPDNAKASMNDGLLEVTLPKKEPKESRKLAIEEGKST